MVWMSDQGVLAKDGRLEKMTLLVSVPIKSLIGTFQKFPYHKPIRVQSMNPASNFSQSYKNKFIVLII